MTSEDLERRVQSERESFSYEPPFREGLLGVPWSKERIAREIAKLRLALVSPKPVPVVLADDPREPSTQMVRQVKQPEARGHVVVFSPDDSRFGLAMVGTSGPPETITVWGDLVSTNAAR